MFEQPAKSDIDAALSILMHETRHQVMDAKNRITSEAIKQGSLLSNRVIIAVADDADKAHRLSIDQARIILLDFVERMRLPATQITQWARPHLENLSNSVLGVVPPNGFPNDYQRVIRRYSSVFKQRVDLALRDVEIGYTKGAGFATRAAMPQEEWIKAADAIALFGQNFQTGTRAICKRAYGGLVKAMAERFIKHGVVSDNVEVPKEFWWAGGGAALQQDWKSGDFETWINHEIHLEAFGVTFCRADIEAMIPTPKPMALPKLAVAAKAAGGRPKASWSDDLWIEMCRQLYFGDLKPKRQADITNAMTQWLSTRGEEPAASTIKERARKLWAVIDEDEN